MLPLQTEHSNASGVAIAQRDAHLLDGQSHRGVRAVDERPTEAEGSRVPNTLPMWFCTADVANRTREATAHAHHEPGAGPPLEPTADGCKARTPGLGRGCVRGVSQNRHAGRHERSDTHAAGQREGKPIPPAREPRATAAARLNGQTAAAFGGRRRGANHRPRSKQRREKHRGPRYRSLAACGNAVKAATPGRPSSEDRPTRSRRRDPRQPCPSLPIQPRCRCRGKKAHRYLARGEREESALRR